MREARFARPWGRAAADDRRHRGRVVRRPEGRHRHERPPRRQQARRPSGSASPRAPRPPAAAAGSPAAGARASSCLFPAAPRAAGCGRPQRRARAPCGRAPGHARRRGPALTVRSRSAPARRARRAEAAATRRAGRRPPRRGGARGTGSIPASAASARALGRAQEPRQAGLPRALCSREHAADGPQPPVKRELADRRVPTQGLRWHLPRGGQHGQRDRQVESRALLTQLGRREVDRDPAHRPLQLRRRDPASARAPSPPGRRGRRGRRSRRPAPRAGGAPRPRRGGRRGPTSACVTVRASTRPS